MMDKKFVKNTKFKKLNTKVNSLEKNVRYFYFNSDKLMQVRQQSLEKNNEDVDKNIPYASGLVTITVGEV